MAALALLHQTCLAMLFCSVIIIIKADVSKHESYMEEAHSASQRGMLTCIQVKAPISSSADKQHLSLSTHFKMVSIQ